jgi:3D (Asp-Asp-Asp) domain-containing protein
MELPPNNIENLKEHPKKSNLAMLTGGLILAFLLLAFTVIPEEKYEKAWKYLTAAVSTASVTVGNSVPVASSATLNGGNAITLTENTTTSITATGTVTDTNGCLDLTAVSIAVFKDGTTCAASGDANNDTCYFWTDASPSTDTSCTGSTDTTYAATHAFSVQYYADDGTWKATVIPSDVGAGASDTSTGVTLNALQALSVSATIAYGSVSNGANSTGDHTATITNTGNTAIDFKISGQDLTCSTLGSIPVANEEHSLSSFTYGSGTALSGTPADVNADLAAPAVATVPVTDLTYWQISVPNGVSGTCSGDVTFTAEAAL